MLNALRDRKILQARFGLADIARVFRRRVALETTVMLALMLLAPAMFRAWGARPVIGACGATWVALGIPGLLLQEKHL